MEMEIRMMRLDKYLADMGFGTRSEVKRDIIGGKVEVDGRIVKQPKTRIDTGKQRVSYMGGLLEYQEYEYYMLNKPAGVVSATTDRRDKTVLDLIADKKRRDLFPVGRLDKDTEGLLLITNDGALAHRLLAPQKHVDKVYYAVVSGIVSDEDVQLFRSGVDIGEEQLTQEAVLEILSVDRRRMQSEIRLTIQEGRFHQVKRMFRAIGKEVTYLKRLAMGSLCLDKALGPGEYRLLTDKELNNLC